jgi:hypothetical protein
MAKECRVALDLFQNRVEKSFENTLFAGECIGYIQGAGYAERFAKAFRNAVTLCGGKKSAF